MRTYPSRNLSMNRNLKRISHQRRTSMMFLRMKRSKKASQSSIPNRSL